jgi:hypothetical protein
MLAKEARKVSTMSTCPIGCSAALLVGLPAAAVEGGGGGANCGAERGHSNAFWFFRKIGNNREKVVPWTAFGVVSLPLNQNGLQFRFSCFSALCKNPPRAAQRTQSES